MPPGAIPDCRFPAAPSGLPSRSMRQKAFSLFRPAIRRPTSTRLIARGLTLYADSVIALDAASGRPLGYNQLINHDSHDYRMSTAHRRSSPPAPGAASSPRRTRMACCPILDRSKIDRTAGASGDALPIIPLLSEPPRPLVRAWMCRCRAIIRYISVLAWAVVSNGTALLSVRARTHSSSVAVDLCAHVQLVRDLTVPATGEESGLEAPSVADMVDHRMQRMKTKTHCV